MQFTATILSVGAFASLALAGCDHNNDAGRWESQESPGDVVSGLCNQGGGCATSNAGGRLCVTGNTGSCGEAVQAAYDWQSNYGDWFLWSSIQCDGLTITVT